MKIYTLFPALTLGTALLTLTGCLSISSPKPTPQTPNSSATTSQARGIDVSDNVGSVNWNKVRADGYTFAFVKATDGNSYSHTDYFYQNWPKMKAAGIIRGAYHFYESKDDPVTQANYFASVLQKAGGLEKTDLPPVLDFERATSGKNVLTFLRTLEAKTGRKPIIYVDESFANTYLTDPLFSSYPLWLAEYGVTTSPKIPKTWTLAGKSWSIWQYTESGTVQGIPGGVKDTDINVFNGSLSDLQKFIRKN